MLELLTLTGRSLPHAIMMMVPEAYEKQADIDPKRRAFYEYHSMLMEPWDGPAALVFTDGTLVGATLDRNGLRPGRCLVTDDGLIVLAQRDRRARLRARARSCARAACAPAACSSSTPTQRPHRSRTTRSRRELAASEPWREWLDAGRIRLADLPEREHIVHPPASVTRRQRTFGYTEEEVRILLDADGAERRRAARRHGIRHPDRGAVSERPRLLFDYFTQQFAQVTNPPLDSIREEVVTSLRLGLGPERNLLAAGPEHARQVVLDFPVIDNDELAKIQHIDTARPARAPRRRIRGLYRVDDGPEGACRSGSPRCATRSTRRSRTARSSSC